MPLFVDQNKARIPAFTMCLDSPVINSNILRSKNNIDLEMPLKFCIDLLEFLYVSNKKLVRQLLDPICTGNRRQILHNPVFIYDSTSPKANYRMKCIVRFLLYYFTAAGKSPENEIVRKFAALKQNSITNLINDVRFEILCSNIQEVDLKDTGIGLIFECFKHLAEIYFTPKFEMLSRTEMYIHSNFAKCKIIIPMLELDDTKSSKGYIDRKSENSVHEINSKKKIISKNSKCINTDIRTDSDDFSALDFDAETNFKIAMYGTYLYNDDNNIGMCEISDNDSDDDDRLREDDDGYEYTREHSMNFDVFKIYNDDEFRGVFNDCILDEIPALSLLPNHLSSKNGESSFCYQCFENPCFEDDSNTENNSYIKMVNDNWKITMESVAEEPIESTKVNYNDDDFKGVFNDYILNKIPAVSLLPNQLSPLKDYPNLKGSSYIKMVNDNWKITMEGVPEGPKESTKVSFVSSPSLVTVRHFELEDDGYRYSTYLMDQMRFRYRIQNFDIIMAPFLTFEHREHILRRNNSSVC